MVLDKEARFIYQEIEGGDGDYILYEIVPGLRVTGTLVKYPTQADGVHAFQALRRFPQSVGPVWSISIGSIFNLVFPGRFIRFDTWVQKFKSNPPEDAEVAGEKVLTLFCRITKLVRQQFLTGGDCFASVGQCLGISDADDVVILKAPQGGRDFNDNIYGLFNMAVELSGCMRVVPSVRSYWNNPTVKIFWQFQRFVGNQYHWWSCQFPINFDDNQKFHSQLFALCHPSSLDEDELFRFFTNLGRLANGDRQSSDHLCYNRSFKTYLNSSTIKSWKEKVAYNRGLQGVLRYSSYNYYDILSFCANSMKHHWQNDIVSSLSRKEVLKLLIELIDGLAAEVYIAYAQAVILGQYEHKYTAEYIFTKDV